MKKLRRGQLLQIIWKESVEDPVKPKLEDQGSWVSSTPKGACMICSPRTSRRKGLLAYGLQKPKLCSFSRPWIQAPITHSSPWGEIPNSYYHYLDIIFFKRQRRATYSKYTELMVAQVVKSALYVCTYMYVCTYNTYLVTSLSTIHTSSTMSLPSPCR